MKNIHELLSAYEIRIPEEKKAEFEKELAANYKTVNDYDKQKEKLRLAEEKAQTTEKALKDFEGVDVEKLRGEIQSLQGDLQKKDEDYQTKVADLEFHSMLDGQISKLQGKSSKAIKALLDMEGLKVSKNQEEDVKKALETMKESEGYLFGTAQTTLRTGMSHEGNREIGTGGGSAANEALRAALGKES